ncbi:MAG: hypothetical protein WCV55_00135 [Candidatus Paceibacterota bacterium]
MLFLFPVFASAVHVNGYYRSNGTYVNSYERTAPDGNPYNNYSYPGNYNPNTGNITGGNSQTYLSNYYNNSSSGSNYSSGYSYPTIPSCPLNSYASGSSCKCNYGYSVSGSSCVSDDSICQDQLGYSSSYDSLSGNCKCSYGYVIGTSGKCVNANSYCSDKLGIMSQYNSSSKKCECMAGYSFDGSSCTYQATDYSYTTDNNYSSNNSISCPINSHVNPSDSTKCICDTNYQNNITNNGCIFKITKTNTEICQDSYGPNADWAGTKISDTQLNCSCKTDYVWNNSKTACIYYIPPSVVESNYVSADTTINNLPPKVEPKKNRID